MQARCFLVTLALTFAMLPRAAYAQESRDAAAAEALFREGRAASDRGDHRTACTKFEESNRLDPAVGTVFNLADCHEKLGELATAWTLFQEVAQRVPSGDDRRRIARERAAALESRLPHLTLRLSGEATDVRIIRDGVSLGSASLGSSLPVDPGEHVISVQAPRRKNAEYRIRLAEGETKVLEISAGPLVAESAAEVVAPAPAKSNRTLGYVLGGIGIAGLVTGTVAGILTLDKKSTVENNCEGHACNRTGYDAAQAGKTLGIITTTGLVVGVAGISAGAYFLLSSPEPAAQSSARDSTRYGVWVSGRF